MQHGETRIRAKPVLPPSSSWLPVLHFNVVLFSYFIFVLFYLFVCIGGKMAFSIGTLQYTKERGSLEKGCRVYFDPLTLAGERGEKAGGQDGYRSVESHCSSDLPPFSGSRNSALKYAILCP